MSRELVFEDKGINIICTGNSVGGVYCRSPHVSKSCFLPIILTECYLFYYIQKYSINLLFNYQNSLLNYIYLAHTQMCVCVCM